jgi:drug/metabolite transporter (DMT)-like permease
MALYLFGEKLGPLAWAGMSLAAVAIWLAMRR